MIEIIAENQSGTQLNLTGSNDYRTTATGFDPSNAVINTSTIGNNDGTVINSARVDNRNIVLSVVLQNHVESARLALYNVFRPKQKVRLYLSTDARNVYIDGYVESLELDHFSNPQTAQISILCTFPFFRNVSEKIQESLFVEALFEFPFAIEAAGIPFSKFHSMVFVTLFNDGEVSSGMQIEFEAHADVVNPIIYNETTHGAIGIMTTLERGQRVIVNTTVGEKSVTGIIDGKEVNYIRYLNKNPEWFQLAPGENYYTFAADSGLEALNVIFRYADLYEGV